jgi:DNA-binding response OmpR family regulator
MVDHTPMKTTILLLVSDSIVCSVLKETLEREGYTVLDAAGLGQAVDWLKVSTPDLLIARTYVQGLSGHDAAVYLRTKCMKMRILILGGLLDDERLQNREALQGFRVFPKPYTAAVPARLNNAQLDHAPNSGRNSDQRWSCDLGRSN